MTSLPEFPWQERVVFRRVRIPRFNILYFIDVPYQPDIDFETNYLLDFNRLHYVCFNLLLSAAAAILEGQIHKLVPMTSLPEFPWPERVVLHRVRTRVQQVPDLTSPLMCHKVQCLVDPTVLAIAIIEE